MDFSSIASIMIFHSLHHIFVTLESQIYESSLNNESRRAFSRLSLSGLLRWGVQSISSVFFLLILGIFITKVIWSQLSFIVIHNSLTLSLNAQYCMTHGLCFHESERVILGFGHGSIKYSILYLIFISIYCFCHLWFIKRLKVRLLSEIRA